jgi:PleD family two-component response regulator
MDAGAQTPPSEWRPGGPQRTSGDGARATPNRRLDTTSHANSPIVTTPPLDHVTGLATRGTLEAFLDARDMSAPLATVLCDVVGLKAANDRDGFTAGDTVLRRAAARLREAAAGATLLARLGGDECVAVFVGPGAADAADRARSILAAPGEPPLRAAAGECLPHETIPAFVDRLYASLRRS